jgi:hypothetical protein
MKKLSVCLTQGAIATFLLGTFGALPSFALFTPLRPVRNNTFEYSFVANWTFAAGAEDNVVLAGPWSANLISFGIDPVDSSKDLFLSGTHMVPPHPGEGPNPFTIQLPGRLISPIAGVQRRGVAEQINHNGHFDIIRVLVQVPANAGAARPAVVTSTGQHVIPSRLRPGAPLTTGSILGITGDVRFKIMGGMQDGQIVGGTVNGRRGPADGTFRGLNPRDRVMTDPLPPDANGYTVVAAVGGAVLPVDPVTTTSLAFLGKVDGVPGQLDLGAAMQLFVGSEEFFAPLLSDQTGRDLFVGIDLTQWLSFPTSFEILDEFSFVDGMSEQLPGILIGTSPVTYDSTLGMFVTDDPATGEFLVTGKIDGRTATVPEPEATLGLLAFSILGTTSALRRIGKQKSIDKETIKVG